MKKPDRSRLQVRRERLRNLCAADLREVAGGQDLIDWLRNALNPGGGNCRQSAVAQ